MLWASRLQARRVGDLDNACYEPDPVWSPDGRWMAWAARSGSCRWRRTARRAAVVDASGLTVTNFSSKLSLPDLPNIADDPRRGG